MGQYDLLYAEQVREIVENGYSDEGMKVRTVWADGTPAHTKSIISKQLVFDGTEVPILTTKKVAWKTAIKELLRFYVERTSNVEGLKVWDEWMRPDGSIGKAYGYQLGKPIIEKVSNEEMSYQYTEIGEWKSTTVPRATYTNQVHKLINGLNSDPSSRRHIITLWNIDDAWDMALQPCVWHNQWLVKGNRLHLIVGIRSNDVALGQPFNVFQYYVLQRMVAQVTGYEIGSLTFNVNDCHLYDRHIEPVLDQIQLEPYKVPKLWISQDVKDIDGFTIDDFILVSPELTDFEIQDMDREQALSHAWYKHHPSIKMKVAI